MTPSAAWYATLTPRWHAGDSAPWLARSGDTVGAHGARMAITARQIWPDASPALLWACIAHDLGEAAAGDAPLAAKSDPTLKSALDRIEAQALDDMGIAMPLSARDRDRLKYLDRLDAYLWAGHHAPHLHDWPEWRKARAWLDAQWVVLGQDGYNAAQEQT
jgi:hypothetical protein